MTANVKKTSKITLTANTFKFPCFAFLGSIGLILTFGIIQLIWHYELPETLRFIIGLPFLAGMIGVLLLGAPFGSIKMDEAANASVHSKGEMMAARIGYGFLNSVVGFIILARVYPLVGISQLYDSHSWIEAVAKILGAVVTGFIYGKIMKAILKALFVFKD